jgi:hypothetical protein
MSDPSWNVMLFITKLYSLSAFFFIMYANLILLVTQASLTNVTK